MKTPSISLRCAITVISIYACISCDLSNPAPEPTAKFEFEVGTVIPGMVHFTNRSENADDYYWDFGDGENSTEEDPEHIYTNNGVYTVTLTSKKNKKTNISSQTVEVVSPFLFLSPHKWNAVSGSGSSVFSRQGQSYLDVISFDIESSTHRSIQFLNSQIAVTSFFGTCNYKILTTAAGKPYIEFRAEGTPVPRLRYALIDINYKGDSFTLTYDQEMLNKELVITAPNIFALPESNMTYVYKSN